MIIPPPGKGSCQNCGYEPDDYTEVARYAAWEAGKYLGKALDQETAGESDFAALGLETTTRKSVTKVIFLFLHTGVEFVMDDLPGAMNEVRGAVVGLTA